MKLAHGSLIDLPALRQAIATACDRGMCRQAVLSVSVGTDYWVTLSFIDGKESNEGKERLFDFASMTKTVIAMMVHAMVKNGIISLDTKVSDVFHGWEVGPSVGELTVRELLVHAGYFNLPQHFKQLVGDEVIYSILGSDVERGVFKYANTCYLLLGTLLEVRTGKNLQELYNELFTGKVHNTSMHWSRFIPRKRLDTVVPIWTGGKSPSQMLLSEMPHDPISRSLQLGHSLSGAAGIYASAPTLNTFFKDVLWGSDLITPESRQMLGVNAVGHLRRPTGSDDATSPVFSAFGMNMETRFGHVVNWSAGHTGCHGLIHDDLQMSAVLMTDAVRYGEVHRTAAMGFFRKTVAGILIPSA